MRRVKEVSFSGADGVTVAVQIAIEAPASQLTAGEQAVVMNRLVEHTMLGIANAPYIGANLHDLEVM